MKRAAAVVGVIGLAAALPGASIGAGGTHEYATGSAKGKLFDGAGGPAQLRVSAHRDTRTGRVSGFVSSQGDLDGAGPAGPFAFAGEVTCVRVEGNHASVKYRFKRAEGSMASFKGGGIQVFFEDNGPPGKGTPDQIAFDPPQPPATFNPLAGQCDQPSVRPDWTPAEQGNYVVRDAP